MEKTKQMNLEEAIKELDLFIKSIRSDLEDEAGDNFKTIKAIEIVLNELDRIKNIDIYKLVEDYETGQLIPREKVENIIEKVRCETTHSYNDWKYDKKVYRAEHTMINIIEKELLNKKGGKN